MSPQPGDKFVLHRRSPNLTKSDEFQFSFANLSFIIIPYEQFHLNNSCKIYIILAIFTCCIGSNGIAVVVQVVDM